VRIVRVMELLNADEQSVNAALARLSAPTFGHASAVPSGVLVTLERHLPWYGSRTRALRVLGTELAVLARSTERTVIVATAIRRNGTTLAAQRAHPQRLRGRWEFPGGKLEKGESPQAAVVRECREELGVDLVVGAELSRHTLPDGAVLLLFEAQLRSDSRDPEALEHLSIGWFNDDELAALDWLDSNRRFVAKLTATTN